MEHLHDYTLDARRLHEMARDPELGIPYEFAEVNDAVEETRQLAMDATHQRHRLIRAAREILIPYPALARWTGMHPSTLHEIANAPEITEEETE